jgi:hypothetical protein
MQTPEAESPARLTALVDRLDYFTEEDVQLLCAVKDGTEEDWRKRGNGPPYVRAGNRYLYPRTGVAQWLAERTRVRRCVPAGSVL